MPASKRLTAPKKTNNSFLKFFLLAESSVELKKKKETMGFKAVALCNIHRNLGTSRVSTWCPKDQEGAHGFNKDVLDLKETDRKLKIMLRIIQSKYIYFPMM